MPACPTCKANYAVGADFCDGCGTELSGATPAVAPAAPAVASVVAAPVAPHPAPAISVQLVSCEKCGSRVPTAKFCDVCGHELGKAIPAPPSAAVPQAAAQPAPASTSSQLVVQTSGRIIQLPDDKDQIHIGRLDAASGNFPEIDLGIESEAVSAGVSRRHAILRRDPVTRSWSVLDGDGTSGSSNGTRVIASGITRKLNPGESARLDSGHEIVLGAFRLTFR